MARGRFAVGGWRCACGGHEVEVYYMCMQMRAKTNSGDWIADSFVNDTKGISGLYSNRSLSQIIYKNLIR